MCRTQNKIKNKFMWSEKEQDLNVLNPYDKLNVSAAQFIFSLFYKYNIIMCRTQNKIKNKFMWSEKEQDLNVLNPYEKLNVSAVISSCMNMIYVRE